MTTRITPFLWFDHQAEEAAHFYASIFRNSKIETVHRHGDTGLGANGTVMTVAFELDAQPFVALAASLRARLTERGGAALEVRDDRR